MDWNRVEGNWKQFKGNVKEKWGKLTDDDLDVIEGKREQLEGKIQQRYGYAKDQARKDVDAWFELAEVRTFNRVQAKAPVIDRGFCFARHAAPDDDPQNTARYFNSDRMPMMMTITRTICFARPSSGSMLMRYRTRMITRNVMRMPMRTDMREPLQV